jgi:hypothetical protein
MKRLIALIVLLFFCSTIAFAQTDYEKKLEYKRKKLDILVKTYLKGEASAYTASDSWSTTISPEAGYSYTYTYGTTRTDKSILFKEVSDWLIIRGGVRQLSDVEFLKITGNHGMAKEVQSEIDERGKWVMIGTIGGLLGIVVAVGGSSDGNTSTITIGSAISLIGFLISSMNLPKKHYIAADYALEESDLYNIRIKKELSLPIDFE